MVNLEGAAVASGGMTSDHKRVLLESEHDTALFCRAAQDLARAHVPPDVLALLRDGSAHSVAETKKRCPAYCLR